AAAQAAATGTAEAATAHTTALAGQVRREGGRRSGQRAGGGVTRRGGGGSSGRGRSGRGSRYASHGSRKRAARVRRRGAALRRRPHLGRRGECHAAIRAGDDRPASRRRRKPLVEFHGLLLGDVLTVE